MATPDGKKPKEEEEEESASATPLHEFHGNRDTGYKHTTLSKLLVNRDID